MKASKRVQRAVDDLLKQNPHTRGKKAAEMYLGKDVLVVRLGEKRVIENDPIGDNEVCVTELMRLHRTGK